MAHERDILIELGKRLMREYCPQCHIPCPTKHDCIQLIAAIATRWKINWDHLPSEETFYHALRGNRCGCAMKEKMAILYYAATDKECAAKMPGLYLDFAKKQRLEETPYWDRFAAEYKKEHQPHAPRFIMPKPYYPHLKAMRKSELEKLIKTGLKVLKEKSEVRESLKKLKPPVKE